MQLDGKVIYVVQEEVRFLFFKWWIIVGVSETEENAFDLITRIRLKYGKVVYLDSNSNYSI